VDDVTQWIILLHVFAHADLVIMHTFYVRHECTRRMQCRQPRNNQEILRYWNIAL